MDIYKLNYTISFKTNKKTKKNFLFTTTKKGFDGMTYDAKIKQIQVVRFTVQGFPLKAGFSLRLGRIFHQLTLMDS